ncbi:hypothetical protein HGRIS_003521 [Hohenbuehelia grisea]|uniref:Peptidase M48 domain-containing protein n=1 Tax=Hohenbuehelia grisea TaxID=104357 RepID=A0ABR3JFQ7_9AGAR
MRPLARIKLPTCAVNLTRRSTVVATHPHLPRLQSRQYGVAASVLRVEGFSQRQQLRFLQNQKPWAPAVGVFKREFHATPRNEGGPLIPLLASVLKAAGSLELVRTAGRIALTFVPFVFLHNMKSKMIIKKAHIHGIVVTQEKKDLILKRMKRRTILLHLLLTVPAVLFWGTIVASLERTPLTGRLRLIILSPEEEDEIAAQLAGPGWYNAVMDILSVDGPPKLIPPSDWRYEWVRSTLRQLESTIPILQQETRLTAHWAGSQGLPLPPPADYPLQPRPRASEYLRRFSEGLCERMVPPSPHVVTGPPYSLLVVEKPEASNAFSYGFGPDGGGGVVVYSGFLDEVLACHPPPDGPALSSKPSSSWFSSLFGGSRSPTPHPIPTPEQTTDLAILLAHELSHLILSHHLETLSSGTIVVPGIASIVSDILRTILFPFTMFWGPFVNDAVAQLGKIGGGELSKVGEYCTSMHQEIEADIVSAR